MHGVTRPWAIEAAFASELWRFSCGRRKRWLLPLILVIALLSGYT